ncbi:MAG: lectin-like protein [Verrucomicrobia bacterium]|nr:lectin-like protein [Verrucomicrobiota bacterium]
MSATRSTTPTATASSTATDLYAIGVMLYQMLTGEVPRGLWTLPAAKHGTDPRFDAIISKAMQTDRETRYQTAAEIRQELDVILTTPRALLIQQQQAAAEAAARATRAQKNAASNPPEPTPDECQKRIQEQPARQAPAPDRKSSLGPVIGIAAALVIIAGLVYTLTPPARKSAPQTAPPTTASMPESAPAPTPVPGGSAGFSNFAPAAQWRDELAGSDDWGPAWQRVGGEMHVIESKNAMHLFADLRRDSALRVRFRSQNTDACLDLIQRLNKVGIGPRYIITVCTKEKNDGTLDLIPLKKDGERRKLAQLKSQPLVNTGTEHTAELYAIGNRLTFFFDGQRLGEARDSTFPEGFPGLGASHGIELIRVETAVLDPQSSTSPPVEVLSFGGHRYQFSPEKLGWEDAKAKAAATGGHLATITSKEENQWILDTFVAKLPENLSLWLGGTNDNPTRQWTWVTGEPFTFTAWGSQEPGGMANEFALCFSRMSKGWGDIRSNGLGQADRRGGYLIEWDDTTTNPVPATPVPVASISSISPSGWTDLLANVDVARDTILGEWQKTSAGLAIETGPAPRVWPIEFKASAPEEYDFEIDFTLPSGEQDVSQILPVPGHWFTARMTSHGCYLGQFLDGKADRDPDRTEARNLDFKMEADHRYRSRVEVRRGSVRLMIDDKEVVAFRGDFKRLTPDPKFAMRDVAHPGVASHWSKMIVHQALLRPAPATETMADLLASHPQIAKLESGFKARYESDAQKPFLTALAALNQSYVTNGITRSRAVAQAKGSLSEVTVLDAEKAAITKGEGVPAEDADTTPAALKTLRTTYRTTLAKITAERDTKASTLYDLYLQALDLYIADLTKTGKLDDVSRVKALRDKIAQQKPQTTIASTMPATPPPSAPTPPAAPPSTKSATTGSTWRTAAEYLVNNGGVFVASTDGTPTQILTAKDIPAGRFEIVELSLDRLNSVLPPLKTKDLLPLVGLHDLRRVMVRPNQPGLGDTAFAFLAGNKELNWINLEGVSDVTDEVLAYLADAKKLDHLGIQYATKFTGKGLDKLPCTESLTSLELLGCGISGDGLKAISTFKALRNLRITAGTCSDKDFALLGGLKSLTNLTVSTTNFGNKAAEAISGLKSLTSLNLQGTYLTNAGLEKLQTLKNLTELVLNGTEVTPKAAAEFQKAMPQCRVSR